ncbi:hypothetical protein [Streptomyces massasporeus]|uniref:hypothetical protein n=1 Tax=Streptomyces massasporeus TaxID=67324 RepID=UPI0036FB5473
MARGTDTASKDGGHSEAIVAPGDFVVRLPEIRPAAAAPPLCAGITVDSPLKRFGARPGTKVAVIGPGGLGHLAEAFTRETCCSGK